MRVLSFAWTIYDDRLVEFNKNCTGGGLVIKNICEHIGRLADSYLMIGQFLLPPMKLGNINIVGTKHIKIDADVSADAKKYRAIVLVEAFEEAIEYIKPDIVNFHGLGEVMQDLVVICQKKNVPFVITDHLYIGLNKNFEKYEECVEWEKAIFSNVELNYITVSTGMKSKILRDYPSIPHEKITPILNGTDFTAEIIESDIVEKYGLKNRKVLLCVGTILGRKNQLQLVRTFQLLKEKYQENICIIFCGKDRMENRLQRTIEEYSLQNNLIWVGAVSSEDMKKYYSIADGLIMPSLAEGLSIAALEMIAYGKPVILYEDSECAIDLWDDRVTLLVKERSDIAMAMAIEEWYETEWNYEYIKDYSKKYTMERMAEDYISYYRKILEKG